MATYLITGSSRGLGLELVTQLAALPSSHVGRVFATARSDSSAKLQEIVQTSSGRVEYVKLDTADKASIKEAAAQIEQRLESQGLDVLINNVGINTMTMGGIEAM